MNILQSIVLGITQGITELLPISSTGHIILVSDILFNFKPNLLLLTTLQLGTTISLLIYFRKILFTNIFTKEKINLYGKILLGSIPTIVLALFFSDLVDRYLGTTVVIVVSLIVWGVVFILIERGNTKDSVRKIEDITYRQAIFMGIAQGFAVVPGTSRSGITTITGILSGIDKYTAIQFSFLLGLPTLLGSFVYEALLKGNNISQLFTIENLIGVVVSSVFGYISILVLQKISKKNFLTVFGVYRIIIGLILLFFIIL